MTTLIPNEQGYINIGQSARIGQSTSIDQDLSFKKCGKQNTSE